ncbi:MAG: SLBB domain-containing protein [Pyrinomonadaceae bacterium]
MKNLYILSTILSILLTGAVFAQTEVAKLVPSTTVSPDAESAIRGAVFGPGDEISGKFIGDADYDFTVTVDENGRIELPFSDGAQIVAQCKTIPELKSDIDVFLKKYLKKPQWNLHAAKRVVSPVRVFGEVMSPSPVDMRRRATLLELVSFANGPTKDAGRVVQVYRPVKKQCSGGDESQNWAPESGDPNEIPSRIFKLSAMAQGLPSDNPVILPGDVIYIPQATPVYIVGEVRQPGAVLLKKDGGTTLFQAVTMVGNVSPEAKSKEVKIYRKKSGSIEQDVIVADLDKIKKGVQKDIFLEPYDMVVVDKAKKPIALLIAEFAVGAAKQVVSSAANTGGMRVMY